MIIVLQVVGGLAVLLGLAAAIYGIPIQEFSFGNTLIQAGTVGFCTGLILLGLSVVATELRQLSRRLAPGGRPTGEPRPRAALPSFGSAAVAAPDGGPLFPRDQPAPPPASSSAAEPSQAPPGAPPPWREERARPDVPAPAPDAAAEMTPQGKPRRNLLFSSTVRKDRDPADAPVPDPRVPPPADEPTREADEAPPPKFEDAWPKAERGKLPEAPLPRRASRMPPPAEAAAAAASERAQSGVTVVKSGVVNGMHYSFYSDGSIEAQLNEGTMRFSSFDELMAHIGQRS